jgi:hypothetical protein
LQHTNVEGSYLLSRQTDADTPRLADPYGDFDPNDPFDVASMGARIDDEPFSVRQQARAEEAWQEYRRGQASTLEDVRREMVADVEGVHHEFLAGREADRTAVA